MSWESLSDEIAEEFGDAAEGRREFFDAGAYSFRKLGGFDNRDLERMAAVWRAAAWAKANPERRREIARRWWHSPRGMEAKARHNARRREERAKAYEKAKPLTCAECKQAFKPRRAGPRPSYCSNRCWQRARYQARTPGARRVHRRSLNAQLAPDEVMERRRAMKRAWWERTKAKREAA